MIALESINARNINRSLRTAGGCPEKKGRVHQATNFVGPGPARDSHLYGDTASYYWNRNLPETTYAHNGGPTRSGMYIPSGSLSYRIDTWIP
jgi:hypothetical protein